MKNKEKGFKYFFDKIDWFLSIFKLESKPKNSEYKTSYNYTSILLKNHLTLLDTHFYFFNQLLDKILF